jgi:hypothetical protein
MRSSIFSRCGSRYAISGERTLEEFYQRLQPFAVPFMALFERDRLPSRSALSRFLAVLTEAPVEALRTLFLDDLLARPLTPDKQTGGLVDRAGNTWIVFDIDGTREAARPRALPLTDELPLLFRRLDDVCAPGYRAASVGKSLGHAQRLLRRTVISGSAVLGTEGMGDIGKNCARGFRETDGSLRVVYGASIHSCRPCEASVSGVNGMATRPKSRAKSACCSTRSLLVPHRSSGEMGAAESIGVPVYGLCETNGSR